MVNPTHPNSRETILCRYFCAEASQPGPPQHPCLGQHPKKLDRLGTVDEFEELVMGHDIAVAGLDVTHGGSVDVISSELPEALMCDRVLVMSQARLVGNLDYTEIDPHGEAILRLYAGEYRADTSI